MIQEINIDGIPVRYSLNAANILAVLGNSSAATGGTYIFPRVPTYDEALHIIYLGLLHNGGHSWRSFRAAYYRGEIHPYKYKNQYTVSMMRWRILARIRQVNKENQQSLQPQSGGIS